MIHSMDVGSAIDLSLINWVFFAGVIIVRQLVSHEGIRSFRLKLNGEGLLLYAEGAAAAVGSWLLRCLFMVLTGRGSVVLRSPDRSFFIALAAAAVAYLPVTLFEESLFRGYVQDHVAKLRGIRFAIFGQAAVFGLMHILSWQPFPGLWIKIAMVTVFGVAMGTAARNGRSLMWGIGFHHWWNMTESLIESPLSLLQITAAGGLTRTAFGEWVGLAAAIVVLGLTRLRFNGRGDNVAVPAIENSLPSSAAGHPIMEIIPDSAEKGEPTIDPGII